MGGERKVKGMVLRWYICLRKDCTVTIVLVLWTWCGLGICAYSTTGVDPADNPEQMVEQSMGISCSLSIALLIEFDVMISLS